MKAIQMWPSSPIKTKKTSLPILGRVGDKIVPRLATAWVSYFS